MKPLRWFLLALLLVPFAVGAQAPAQPPLVMRINDDLWAWSIGDAVPRRLTDSGHVYHPVISPDGARLAYVVDAPITIDALNRLGGIGGGRLPGDVWVLDLATGQATAIAVQPPDATFFVDGVPDNNIVMRSDPVWSPDGTMLAWTDQLYPQNQNRLLVYTFASGLTRVLTDDLPPQAGVPAPLDLIWGQPGLAVRSTRVDSTGRFVDSFLMYDVNGNLLATIPVPMTDERIMVDYLWIDDQGVPALAVLYSDDTWDLLDPLTGAARPLNGEPAMVSALAPGQSLGLVPQPVPGGYSWLAYDTDGAPVQQFPAASNYGRHRVALSPDGRAIAFSFFVLETATYENVVRIVQGDQGANVPDATPDQRVGGIVWAPVIWRVRAVSPMPAGTPAGACPGLPAPRLTINGQGRVLPGTSPNNVRAQPSTGAARLGQIPAGGAFIVLAGPVCADGFAWWQVNYNGLVGWTAEGQGLNYWLEPLSAVG